MTQTNNEREKLDVRYFNEKLRLVLEGLPNYTRSELARELQRLSNTASPISQNDQHEVVAYADASLVCTISTYMIKELESRNETNKFPYHLWPTKLYTSPKQIPDGWKPIETAPKDGTQVLINCTGGRISTAFFNVEPFIGEGWHVVVPCMGGIGSGTDTYIHFPEDMPTHWMPLQEAPTTSLTSETNTEVGND